VNSDAREGYAVHAFYKTPAVLLLYTVKSGKIIGSGRGTLTVNSGKLKTFDI